MQRHRKLSINYFPVELSRVWASWLRHKVLTMDDELCSVGSANFNNRSIGFDPEWNIAIDARGEERTRRVIAGLRNGLLAEHLRTQPEAVASEMARQNGSLIKTIDALKHPGGTLEPIDLEWPVERAPQLLETAGAPACAHVTTVG